MVIIFRKQVVKQRIGKIKENSEIVAILNKYKVTLNDLIDNSDAKSPDQLGLINKRLYNALKSENSPRGFLKQDCLDDDVLNRSSRLAPKSEDSQVYQRHDIILFSFKSRRSQFEKVQKGEKEEKYQKSEKSHVEGKINPMIGKTVFSKINIYHHKIYGYQQKLVVLR